MNLSRRVDNVSNQYRVVTPHSNEENIYELEMGYDFAGDLKTETIMIEVKDIEWKNVPKELIEHIESHSV